MDLLTQGLLGAAMAQTVAQQNETRRATVIGFLSGLVADADVLIQSSSDPLFMLEYHRHFTHSVFFIPIGAFLAALILWPFFRSGMHFSRVYIFSLLGVSLSGFIDTCTSYGTYLLWPLLDERISFHIISIVDPIFTLVLFAGVLTALIKVNSRSAIAGLGFCAAWLVLGWWQHERVELIAHELAETRGHTIDKIIVKPTLGNLILWRSTYISEKRIYVDGIRIGLLGNKRVYAGESVALFIPGRDQGDIPRDSVLYQDILRFSRLVDGYVAINPSDKDMLGDLRYSLLPTSTEPLWAITLDRNNYNKHVEYNFYRNAGAKIRQRFLAMLFRQHKPGG